MLQHERQAEAMPFSLGLGLRVSRWSIVGHFGIARWSEVDVSQQLGLGLEAPKLSGF